MRRFKSRSGLEQQICRKWIELLESLQPACSALSVKFVRGFGEYDGVERTGCYQGRYEHG